MAKTLYLMRHAKSNWADMRQSDFDRPLNQRGLRDAPEMGLRLAKRKVHPDIIVCSPAQRTRETIELIAPKIGVRLDRVVFQESLYEASTDAVLEIIRSIPDRYKSALIIGHNPSIGRLVNQLADVHIDQMPTCAIATLKLETDRWMDIDTCAIQRSDFDYPKNLQ